MSKSSIAPQLAESDIKISCKRSKEDTLPMNSLTKQAQADQKPCESTVESRATSELVSPAEIGRVLTGPYKDKQLDIFARNYRFVFYVDGGISIREAMERVGLICTYSAARKMYKRYREIGNEALMDGRWFIRHQQKVLTPEVMDRLLQWYFARPAAGYKAIHCQIEKEHEAKGLKPPSYETVKKFFAGLPKSYKQFRRGQLGIKEWNRETRPVVRYEITKFSNERWQVDHQQLRIWAREKVGDRWVPCEVHISAFLDAHSRSISGFTASVKHPDSWTNSILLMKAVLPKDNPSWANKCQPLAIQPDRAKVFMSKHAISMMARLGIRYIFDPPYYPNNKGKVERWFLTLDSGCLRILPGHMDAIGVTRTAAERHISTLLTVPQLRQEIERWIVQEYHQAVHSETNRKPAELWEETVQLIEPESEEVFMLSLLKDDEVRIIRNTGVKFTPRGIHAPKNRYWSPEMTHHGGRKVRVNYNPDELDCVRLHCAETSKFICEAWLMNAPSPRYTVEDVKRARNSYRRGLYARIKEYRAKIEREDRLSAQQIEWNKARHIAEIHRKQAIDVVPDEPHTDEVEALIRLLEQQAAGEE